ncbi:hypothetical protein ACIPF8_19990 [Collimonas sp. NPDC087041]|uniref:hypothetical protein n=1 Tax=Collimonas sp. NPDC087041 TaxID=3363960 RepID=UPI003807874D
MLLLLLPAAAMLIDSLAAIMVSAQRNRNSGRNHFAPPDGYPRKTRDLIISENFCASDWHKNYSVEQQEISSI